MWNAADCNLQIVEERLDLHTLTCQHDPQLRGQFADLVHTGRVDLVRRSSQRIIFLLERPVSRKQNPLRLAEAQETGAQRETGLGFLRTRHRCAPPSAGARACRGNPSIRVMHHSVVELHREAETHRKVTRTDHKHIHTRYRGNIGGGCNSARCLDLKYKERLAVCFFHISPPAQHAVAPVDPDPRVATLPMGGNLVFATATRASSGVSQCGTIIQAASASSIR